MILSKFQLEQCTGEVPRLSIILRIIGIFKDLQQILKCIDYRGSVTCICVDKLEHMEIFYELRNRGSYGSVERDLGAPEAQPLQARTSSGKRSSAYGALAQKGHPVKVYVGRSLDSPNDAQEL